MKHLLILLSLLILTFPLVAQETGVLYFKKVNGKFGWFENGIGEWKDGKKYDQGTMTLSDGTKYVGEFKVGVRNGLGTKTWSNGDKYQGEWKNSRINGQGTYTSQDGTKGKGEFKDNTPWNISLYGKYGNFTGKYVNGVKQ